MLVPQFKLNSYTQFSSVNCNLSLAAVRISSVFHVCIVNKYQEESN